MNEQNYAKVKANVSLLGRLLGDIIGESQGDEFLELIESIRNLSKSARAAGEDDHLKLQATLANLDRDQLLPVARAFAQFLNLANIADQHHTLSREMDTEFAAANLLGKAFAQLAEAQVPRHLIQAAVESLRIELVLTAHPTEITRRTLIHKYAEIDACLGRLELQGQAEREQEELRDRLRELVSQIWHSTDFRAEKPTPVDEARWGFAVVENSLWDAVPVFVRRLDRALLDATGGRLPVSAAPVAFASWMGGDRDGNPNVTARVTDQVLLLSRWQAAALYRQAVDDLVGELSMTDCNAELRELSQGAREPYRAVLRHLRERLLDTLRYLEAQLEGRQANVESPIRTEEELWRPLHCCYQSLLECGMQAIANRALLDLLRRVRCFGVHLVRHDIRQESSRHTQVFSELCRFLGLGDYATWTEAEKLRFLCAELNNRRPLMPPHWQPGDDVREVLDTFAVIARQPAPALGAYVISMARQASDVLAVQLLLKETGCQQPPPVAPLFETLDDLNRAPRVIETLLAIKGYRALIGDRLMVMIGYSDSAKDAGVTAAAWAQYRAQEALLQVCEDAGISLTLFHGRGGTIGRGGAPAHAALLSQPPGSLKAGLRVTEQGEMIRTKLGLSPIAINTLALYTGAILEANLLKPPKPEDRWRRIMDTLSDASCQHYRAVVREDAQFVTYFRQATPEQELAKLPLGSRPSRRKLDGGIDSLRAIPWIFAWSQNRLMLPAWLGAAQALQEVIDSGQGDLLKEMASQWPFFATRLSMLEMVYAKADTSLSAYYDSRLVAPELQSIGAYLRAQLHRDIYTILALNGATELLANQPWSRQSIGLRNIYIDPLNVLQAELIQRYREHQDPVEEQALMVTIAGVAAGMRNTG